MLAKVLGSIFSGGVTGLLGVVFQRSFDFLKVKQEIQVLTLNHAHEINMRRVDAEIMEKEWAARAQVASIEAAGKAEVAAENSFAASFAMEPKQYSEKVKPNAFSGFVLVLLDFVRGIVRPGLTVYLCAITTMVYLEAKALIGVHGAFMLPEQAIDIHQTIVSTILYLTTTCVLWWFGTRNRQKAPGAK
jgi:hypothetical protein